MSEARSDPSESRPPGPAPLSGGLPWHWASAATGSRRWSVRCRDNLVIHVIKLSGPGRPPETLSPAPSRTRTKLPPPAGSHDSESRHPSPIQDRKLCVGAEGKEPIRTVIVTTAALKMPVSRSCDWAAAGSMTPHSAMTAMRRSRGEGTYPDRHRDDGGVEDASITRLRLGGFHDSDTPQCHRHGTSANQVLII